MTGNVLKRTKEALGPEPVGLRPVVRVPHDVVQHGEDEAVCRQVVALHSDGAEGSVRHGLGGEKRGRLVGRKF